MDELVRKLEVALDYQASILRSQGMSPDVVRALMGPTMTLLQQLKDEIASTEVEERCACCQAKMGIYWECIACTNMVCEDCIDDQGVCTNCAEEKAEAEFNEMADDERYQRAAKKVIEEFDGEPQDG